MPADDPVTIGVAIAVPEPWGAQLQDYRAALGDETARGIPTHITLAPPCALPAATLPDVEQHLCEAARAHDAFDVHLRGTGTFRPVSPVVFVALASGISACEQLATSVRSGPLDVKAEFPYHPHVTVAHDLDEATLSQAFDELAGFEARFFVSRFSLYRHEVVEGWVPTRHFRLAG